MKSALEESAHYSLISSESTLEWAYTGAAGDSNIRLGPNHRFFNTGFSYQLHCARYLVGAFQRDGPPTDPRELAHISRCLNVIKHFVMCSADTTLEPAVMSSARRCACTAMSDASSGLPTPAQARDSSAQAR